MARRGHGGGARRLAVWLVGVAAAVAACARPGGGALRDGHVSVPASSSSGVRGPAPPTHGARQGGGRDTSAALTITVNVPAYRLDVHDGGVSRSYRVAVGERRYPTPRGAFRVREIVWNPWWVPPPSDWARDERAMPPGPDNPMGRVKLRFVELVFIHGTPRERSLGSAASHACIRMANADAIALARLVHRHALPEVPEAVIDSALADSTRTWRFAVRRPVPVTVRYDVAEVRRDTLWVYPDVYRLGRAARAEAMRALAAAGADTLLVDASALDVLVRAGRRRASSAALADLVLLSRSAASATRAP